MMSRILGFVYGLVCYILFIGTFIYAMGFVGNLVVPKSIDSGDSAPIGQALLVNALLLVLFAVQHSVMARPAFKHWWTRFIPASIERSTYVLLTSLALILLFWQWRPLPAIIWDAQIPWIRAALWGLFALGWGIVIFSSFLISHAYFFGLKQVYDHLRDQEPSPLDFKTPGLYRYLRHPMMLGFFIAFWFIPRMTAGHLFFSAVSSAYILIALQLEERDLLHWYGQRYQEYKERIPMLIPRLRGRTREESKASRRDRP